MSRQKGKSIGLRTTTGRLRTTTTAGSAIATAVVRTYYNETRTHLSLDKDAPVSRAIEVAGRIFGRPVLGGLHHQYVRI